MTRKRTYGARKNLKLKNIKENGHRVKTAYSFRTQPCSYCCLTGEHHKGRTCPAHGVQCETCRKYNHFTSVCREKRKRIELIDETMRPPHCYTCMKRKEGINKENVIHHNSHRLDDSSVAYHRIKTAKQSLSSREWKFSTDKSITGRYQQTSEGSWFSKEFDTADFGTAEDGRRWARWSKKWKRMV